MIDLEKLNKVLPMCVSPFEGERTSAWRRVEEIVLPAIESGQFHSADFQIGGSKTAAPVVTQENIEDIIAREMAHLKGQIDTHKRTVAKLEKNNQEMAGLIGNVDVTKYEHRIRQLKQENEELKAAVAAHEKPVRITELEGQVAALTTQLADRDQQIQVLTQRGKRRSVPEPMSREDRNKEWGALKSPEAYQMACRLHIEQQKSAAEVAQIMGLLHITGNHVGQPRTGVLDGAFNNKGPNEALLGRVVDVLATAAGQPMDFYELWKVGFALHGDQWRRNIARQFGTRPIGRKPPDQFLTQAQMDQLRRHYHTMMQARQG